MIDTLKDEGIIQVLAERMEKQRLPQALTLKDHVDKGGTLSEYDVQFLEDVFKDAGQIQSLLERHPKWQGIAVQMIHLYKEITDKAIENEKAKGGY